ncbi:cysteine hydrolase [Longispora sp. NPDC051575]|uniref:cysteine hydrolase n=1 Tax=Longispora sp. NPDC051575 TaxID=3154943 RepID=UPI0034405C73
MSSVRSVLIVVDMQNGFVREKSEHVVPIVVDLVERWQAAGGDTLFTRYINYPGSPFERLIHWSRLQSQPEIDFVPELVPYVARATAVLDKLIYTPFTDAGASLIQSHGWTDLYICGLATESCVLKTAVDAFERDLTPWVIEDASGSHAGQEAHDAGILVTSRFIGSGQIINRANIPESLLRIPN